MLSNKVIQNYAQVVLKKKEENVIYKCAVRQFKKTSRDQDRMIILLVSDEFVVVVSSGPCGAEKVSTANRQSELRH